MARAIQCADCKCVFDERDPESGRPLAPWVIETCEFCPADVCIRCRKVHKCPETEEA